jgi:hypothetical protein
MNTEPNDKLSTEDEAGQLRQAVVMASPFRSLALWLLVNRRSVIIEADIPMEEKRELVRALGYSVDVLDWP